MSDVFVSYSRRDSAVAGELARALEERGKTVWLDVEGIEAGEVFPAALRAAIEASDTFVFLLSPDSVKSPYCAEEIAHAEGLQKRILPVLLRPPAKSSPIPEGIRERHWIRADRDLQKAVDELLAAIDTDLAHVRGHTRWLVKALEWKEGGQLLTGTELAAAEAWLTASAGKQPQPVELHREYVRSSHQAANRRLRRLAVVASLTAVVALALLAFAVKSRHDAVVERSHAQAVAQIAVARQLGIAAQTDPSVDRAMLLARESVALDDSPITAGDLLATLLRAPEAIGILPGVGNRHQQMALSPDGRTLLLAGAHGDLVVLDTQSRKQIKSMEHIGGTTSELTAVTWSRDGARVALGNAAGEVLIVDTSTWQVVRKLATLRPHGVFSLAFSRDSSHIAAACGCSDFARIGVWDSATGARVTSGRFRGSTGGIFFLPGDKDLLVTMSPGASLIVDANTLTVRRRVPGDVWNTALSPDGRILALGSQRGVVSFMDLHTLHTVTAPGGHDDKIYSLTFSADGSTMVTTSADGRAIVWNVAKRRTALVLGGFSGCSCGAAISPDDSTLYTDGFGGNIVIWDLKGNRRFVRPFTMPGGSGALAALSPDGAFVVQTDQDGSGLVVRNQRGPRRTRHLRVGTAQIADVAFLGDSQHLAVVSRDGSLDVVNPSARSVRAIPGTYRHASGVAPAGSHGIALLFPHQVRVYSPSGKLRTRVAVTGAVSLSYDGRHDRYAIARDDGRLTTVDAGTGAVERTWKADDDFVADVAFSPDGRRIVTAGDNGARVWEAETGTPVTAVLAGELNPLLTARFSPDGRWVVTSSAGGTIRLYAATSGAELGPSIGTANTLANAWFTPDGKTLIGLYDSGDGFEMSLDRAQWAATACAIAGRPMSRSEWASYIPDRPYRPSCGAS